MQKVNTDTQKTPITIDLAYLTGLVQAFVNAQAAEIRLGTVNRVQGGFEFGSSIYRLRGTALVDEEKRPWSLIIKTIKPEADSADPDGYRYWRREIQAYQSGILYDLPGQITAPRLYAIDEKPDGSVWIWMEDIQDELEHPWSIQHYARIAQHLGASNGAYLAGRPLPNQDWITDNWLRKFVVHADPMIKFIHKNPAHRSVQFLLSGMSLLTNLALWDEHPRMLQLLDRLPQTFCHQDACGLNLFYRQGSVIAIDWGFAGIAPVGAELAALIGVAFSYTGFPSSQAKALDQACFKSYLAGLRQAGWKPDPQQVRVGFTLTMILRNIFGGVIGEIIPVLLNENTRQKATRKLGARPEDAGKTDAGVVAYYQEIGQEAVKFLGIKSIIRCIGRTGFYAISMAPKRLGNFLR
jgi:hypothetical protein